MSDQPERICARCGHEIRRSAKGQNRARFCSSDCRDRFHRERTRVQRPQAIPRVAAAKRMGKRG